jgi:hypothetical protein
MSRRKLLHSKQFLQPVQDLFATADARDIRSHFGGTLVTVNRAGDDS